MQGAAVIEIPGYTILGQIGRGGMATVYRARQILLDRDVALKVMSSQLATDPVYAQRFLQEARMLAALNHPHIVQVYDIGETPGGLNYFSMQLLSGGDFAGRMRDGMSEEELVRVLAAVAQALGFAHARGYVHRDVTPANILFDSHDQPVLTDFGIARALASTSRITSAGLSIGTSQYMSPEQARGAEVDHRSDIYSLGVLCFEAVAGHPPFQGDDGFAVAFSHVHDPVPRLPPEAERWQPLIDQAMAKDPAERFADCQAFIEGLRAVAPEEFASAIGSAAAPPPARPSGKTDKRPAPTPAAAVAARSEDGASRRAIPWLPVGLAAGAVLSGAVLAFGVWSWMQGDKGEKPKPVVTTPKTSAKTPVKSVAPPVEVPPELPPSDLDSVVDATAGVAVEPVTVIDPVATLVQMGRYNLQQGRLTSPKPNNAFDRFSLALLIEPDNADAQSGIASVARAYFDQAKSVDVDRDTARWLELLDNASTVALASNQGAAVNQQIRDLRAAEASRLVSSGEQALIAWDAAKARRAFETALQIDDDLAAARRGLAQSRALGKVGYVFRDGEIGPSLVMVSETLAMAQHEISVGDFRAYWDAAGKAKFGAKLPNCRERELSAIGNFFSGGKGSWQSPQIKQDDRHPVVCVNYAMAEAYAAWLSERSGQRYRLPTAAELNPYTGGAGCSANVRDKAYGREFPGKAAVDCDDGYPGTAPVGSFAAIEPGLFDSNGNVREWTSDCVGGRCTDRIAIGVSWESDSLSNRRKEFPADTGSNTIGFRVVREINPSRTTQP